MTKSDDAVEQAMTEALKESIEAGAVLPSDELGFRIGFRAGAATIDRVAVVRDAFEKGRASVVFEPHSAYRDLLRQMICEGDFDFTKIFEEIEYEGETYADISNEGADALADYFIDLMEQIDERRSEEAESVRRNICDTCEQPYIVNSNYDRHDCGVAVIEEMEKGK